MWTEDTTGYNINPSVGSLLWYLTAGAYDEEDSEAAIWGARSLKARLSAMFALSAPAVIGLCLSAFTFTFCPSLGHLQTLGHSAAFLVIVSVSLPKSKAVVS